jgi:hypothetical protein
MTTRPITLAFGLVEGIAVMVHGEQQPTDPEWDSYLEYAKSIYPQDVRGQLVLSYGGAPSSRQRTAAALFGKKAYAGQPVPPSAILTNSLFVRAVVTVYRWTLSTSYKAFAVDDFAGAGEYLGLSPEQLENVKAYLFKLLSEIKASVA